MKNMQKRNNATSSNSSTLSDSSSVSRGAEEAEQSELQAGHAGTHKEWQQRVAEWKMVPLTLIAGPLLALATKAVWPKNRRG